MSSSRILESLKQHYRQQRYKYSREISERELTSIFDELDLTNIPSVLIHSSIKRINRISGGFDSIIRCIQSISEDINILVPTAIEYQELIKPSYVYNAENTPSGMGAFSEYIRNLPGATRSFHPTHNVAVIGNSADGYVRNHHMDETPFGKNSPFYRNMLHGGKVLLIGVNLNSMSSFHLYEDLIWPKVNFGFYNKDLRRFECEYPGAVRSEYLGYEHNSDMAYSRDVERMRRYYIKYGALKERRLGWGSIVVVSPLEMTKVNLIALQQGYSAYGRVQLNSKELEFVSAALSKL